MKYYKCKCGSRELCTTNGVPDCIICCKCKTTLAGEREVKPHDFKTYYDQSTGKPFKFCTKCHSRENIQESFM